jgi:Zn-dependent protease
MQVVVGQVYCRDMLDNANFTSIVVVIVSILASMVVHEFMHAWVGHQLGDTTAKEEGRLTLNPLAHIDPIMTLLLPAVTLLLFHAPILAAKPVPFNPARLKYDEFGAAMVAAAGPLSNLALAFIAAILLRPLDGGSFLAQALQVFVELNVALFVFNILPIPPLDGSRVLYAFAPRPLQELLEQLEPIGLFIIFGLVLLGGFGGLLGNLNQFILNLLP